MSYSALDIAKYVITSCSVQDQPVSNLKLQKMLYFLWVDFYKTTGRMLFEDNICAWKLGPVVPEVYYAYCHYAGTPISLFYDTNYIRGEDQKILNDIISRYLPVPANDLVERTHVAGSAWHTIYQDGAGNRKVIPFELIIMKEAS